MNAKKIIVPVVVILVLFFVITRPGQSANVVTDILDWLKGAADAVVSFVHSLFV